MLLFLGGLASIAGSEAVLPAYLVGMVLAPTFLTDRELPNRMRIVAFTILTPFYFLKAGSLVEAHPRRRPASSSSFSPSRWPRSSSASCR